MKLANIFLLLWSWAILAFLIALTQGWITFGEIFTYLKNLGG